MYSTVGLIVWVQAKNLAAKDRSGTSDPVSIPAGGEKQQALEAGDNFSQG